MEGEESNKRHNPEYKYKFESKAEEPSPSDFKVFCGFKISLI
jgi:hypothetical protein